MFELKDACVLKKRSKKNKKLNRSERKKVRHAGDHVNPSLHTTPVFLKNVFFVKRLIAN